MARRSRKSKALFDKLSGILLAVIGIVLLVALGGAYWWVQRSRVMIDAETNCPLSGPKAIHLVLFDRSDPISDQQAQRVRQTITRLRDEAPSGLRFDIYTFEGDTTHVLQPKLQICAPGKPDKANELTENKEMIRRNYEKNFVRVVDLAVNDLLGISRQDNSPIIESLRAAAITSFGPVEQGQIPLYVTMISDMVQHTALVSQFKADLSFQQVERSNVWPSLRPQLKGANVTILYLLRPSATRNHAPIQSRGHQAFWEALVSASGGIVSAIEPL